VAVEDVLFPDSIVVIVALSCFILKCWNDQLWPDRTLRLPIGAPMARGIQIVKFF
jgi:hypothetical protein